MSYIDGFVLPIAKGKTEEYRKMAEAASTLWMEHGALAFIEAVGDDLSPQMPADAPPMRRFNEMANTEDGADTMFSFILYRDRAHRDEVNAKVMADPRMKDACPSPESMPFDCSRMAYGGFKVIVEKGTEKL